MNKITYKSNNQQTRRNKGGNIKIKNKKAIETLAFMNSP